MKREEKEKPKRVYTDAGDDVTELVEANE